MKNTILLFLLIIAPLLALADDYPSQDIVVNGKKVATISYFDCMFGTCDSYIIKDTSGVILFKILSKTAPVNVAVTKDNERGIDYNPYYEWVFYQSKTKVETERCHRNKVLKEILQYELFNENGLSETAISNLLLEQGTRYSELQKNKSNDVIYLIDKLLTR
jgi:hypothetical protein